jgi:hypothetical protein
MASVPFAPQNNFIDNIDIQMEEALTNGPPVHVNGQNYGLIIYLAPQGTNQRNIEAGMMLLGTFNTEELAKAHIAKLARMGYVFFDIFIVEMYRFFPLPPPTDMSNSEYINDEMNKIMQYHRNAVVNDQAEVQRRVDECRAKTAEEAQGRAERMKVLREAPPDPELNKPEEEKKKDEDLAAQGKRMCTDEERAKVRMVMGEPIFIEEKDIPAGATVIDLSASQVQLSGSESTANTSSPSESKDAGTTSSASTSSSTNT